jgi:dihydrofolate reductase
MKVVLLAVQSLDGFITRHDEPGSGFASAADRAHFSSTLSGMDCSIMGRVTYEQVREEIKARLGTSHRRRIVLTRSPARYASETVAGRLEFSSEAPKTLLERLKGEGHRMCALLGGAEVHSLFLEQGWVTEVWLTLEPRIFGGGTQLVSGRMDTRLELLSCDQLGKAGSLLVKYKVVPPAQPAVKRRR